MSLARCGDTAKRGCVLCTTSGFHEDTSHLYLRTLTTTRTIAMAKLLLLLAVLLLYTLMYTYQCCCYADTPVYSYESLDFFLFSPGALRVCTSPNPSFSLPGLDGREQPGLVEAVRSASGFQGPGDLRAALRLHGSQVCVGLFLCSFFPVFSAAQRMRRLLFFLALYAVLCFKALAFSKRGSSSVRPPHP